MSWDQWIGLVGGVCGLVSLVLTVHYRRKHARLAERTDERQEAERPQVVAESEVELYNRAVRRRAEDIMAKARAKVSAQFQRSVGSEKAQVFSLVQQVEFDPEDELDREAMNFLEQEDRGRWKGDHFVADVRLWPGAARSDRQS